MLAYLDQILNGLVYELYFPTRFTGSASLFESGRGGGHARPGIHP